MATSTTRRYAGVLPTEQFPYLDAALHNEPKEVDWTAAAGISVTPGGSNAKGAYTTLFASLAADCDLLIVNVLGSGANATDTSVLADIATGAAASEVDVVPNWCAGYTNTVNTSAGKTFAFPVHIKSGTRISMRAQGAQVGPAAITTRVIALSLPYGRSPTYLVNMGANLGTSKGVSITSAATWTQITAATADQYQGLVLTFGGNGDTTFSAANDSISLGVGAGGSETEILRALFRATTSEMQDVFSSNGMLAARNIGKGARIAVQGNNATTNQLDACVLGVPFG